MKFKAALIQMRSGRDVARNFQDASQMIREAHSRGARFVVTPEMTNIIEPDRARLNTFAKMEAEDQSVAGFAELAKRLGLWLNIGSLALKSTAEKLVNRAFLFSPRGGIMARYDKIHLFDVDLPDGQSVRESQAYEAGCQMCVSKLPWAKVGMTICYDVRFPAIYSELARSGAEVVTVPSAFTVPTGKAHWHVLMRARAIETGCFVLAAAQGGRHESGRETFGHSLAISPWGEVLAEAGSEPGVFIAEVDVAQVADARRRIPALQHKRAFTLRGPLP